MQNEDQIHGDAIIKDGRHPWSNRASATGHRRKPFRAMAFLTCTSDLCFKRFRLIFASYVSVRKTLYFLTCFLKMKAVAADLDVIMDWIFFREVLNNDRDYRREYIENGSDEKKLPYLIPPLLIALTLASCIIGTLMWIILATDGRIITPILRRLGIDKLSIGITLFLCVVLEDIPQVVLTFLIEDYYEEDNLSTIAVCNVMASLYDTLIKLAEAIDERHDMVETGAWCKHSIADAHTNVISAVVTLCAASTNSISKGENTNINQSLENHKYMKSTRTLALATTQLPSLRFMTASLDGTVRLWNSSNRLNVPGYTVNDTACVRVYKGRDLSGVTCLALLGEKMHPNKTTNIKPHISNSNTSHFLSGHQNGVIRLWHIENCEKHLCDYRLSSSPTVAGMAVVKPGEFFVAAYQNGMSHLWDAWSGACIARFSGHKSPIRGICAMGDGEQFVTGSEDNTLRLWDIRSAMRTASLPNKNTSLQPTKSQREDDLNVSFSPEPYTNVLTKSVSFRCKTMSAWPTRFIKVTRMLYYL
jgi:WD domain, G-beta repeat